ncbi:hypothetical protein GCM10010515_56890 [Streptomyces fructofermentans]|uniref:Uncharacterized protein n=1 Tax=Streptomyces fructofermentans TaxID=152141 RepID=A0A918NMZ3_9ACTN|nr:hypothetical protein GCM10010515_56890 [Streptomyces fructofermentans]
MPAILAAVLNCSVRPGLVPEFTQHRARQVRVEFTHALSAHFDLVALKRAADAGPAKAGRPVRSVGPGAY